MVVEMWTKKASGLNYVTKPAKKSTESEIAVQTDLGGLDGAITEAKYSWLYWLPRITSATVLIVSVSTSAGTPLAINISHNFASIPV